MTIAVIVIIVLCSLVIALLAKCNCLEAKLEKTTQTALKYMNIEQTRRKLDRRKHYRHK